MRVRLQAHLDQAAAAATAAFHVCPSLQLLTDAMLAHPTEDWQQRCSLTPGRATSPPFLPCYLLQAVPDVGSA